MTNNDVETERRSFLGIPVVGDVDMGGDDRTPQRPLEDLEPTLRALLNDPEFYAFGWTQYTPYFNDGEPCTFRVNSPWFLTRTDVVNLLKDAGRPTEKATPKDQAREVLLRAGLDPDSLLQPTEAPPAETETEAEAGAEVDVAELPDFDALPDDWDEEDYQVDYGSHPSLGRRNWAWTRRPGTNEAEKEFNNYEGTQETRYDMAMALNTALDSGAFNDVLLTAFGDHAQVIVRASGISVDSYEHD